MISNSSYEYSVSPDAYLERARDLLLEDRAASLFYAALELRCFMEARQDMYLDAQRKYANSVPKRWKIGAQGKALEAIFDSKKTQHIKWNYEGELIFDEYHIPVSSDLRKRIEKLDELRHAQGKRRDSGDEWWKATRSDLIETYEIAWLCNQGGLLSPMFLHNGKIAGDITENIYSNIMLRHRNDGMLEKLKEALKVGAIGTLTVDYPEQLPKDWHSDIFKVEQS